MDKPTSEKDVIKSLGSLSAEEKYERAQAKVPIWTIEIKGYKFWSTSEEGARALLKAFGVSYSQMEHIKVNPPLIKDVVKSLEEEKRQSFANGSAETIEAIRPTWHKMLRSLKQHVYHYRTSEGHVNLKEVEAIIKEAEELGL